MCSFSFLNIILLNEFHSGSIIMIQIFKKEANKFDQTFQLSIIKLNNNYFDSNM